MLKETIQRIVKDVKYIKNNNLDNIYYIHDEDNILLGYALIIGNKNTPYSYGNYLFKFEFPDNYPFSPPKLTFLSNDGITRFNPNFYINGKVCLSILNTWHGEGWSSCQSIYSILLILYITFNEKPLINEPNIFENENNYNNINNYNLIIKYKNIEFSILKQIEIIIDNNNNSIINYIGNKFKDIIIENFNNNINNIEKIINTNFNTKTKIYLSIYNLNIKINKEILITYLNKIKLKINKLNIP